MKSHILELRARLLKIILTVGLCFMILFYFRQFLYDQFALPLLSKLPSNSHLVATNITDTLIAPMKLCFITSLYICMPVVIYQVWAFVAPGLYKHEKKATLPMIFYGCLLFYLGSFFAFSVIIPISIKFFVLCSPEVVTIMADIGLYVNFVATILLVTGIVFQIPLITHAIIKFELASYEQLKIARPYVILAAFILGMLLTPPDVISQILLAVPMWGLYELGLLFSNKKSSKR